MQIWWVDLLYASYANMMSGLLYASYANMMSWPIVRQLFKYDEWTYCPLVMQIWWVDLLYASYANMMSGRIEH